MSSCTGAPLVLNPDISGIGVRVSFYLQTLFLGCLSARAGSVNEVAGALYTLMATNTAMAVTGLILGLKSSPEISFQDAVIILYLLSMAWIVVIASSASCNRLSDDTMTLQLCSVIQSYLIIAFAFAVLAKAPGFGENPGCNRNAIVVIFRPFSALHSGRIFGWVVVSIAATGYTVMTVRDCTAKVLKKIRKRKGLRDQVGEDPPPTQQEPRIANLSGMAHQPVNPTILRESTYYGTPRALIDGQLLFTTFFIVIFWILFVLNTELVIRWNQNGQDNSGLAWQFGQILPMFLSVVPLINLISAFNKYGIKPTKQVYQRVKVPVIYDVEFDARLR